MNQDSSSLPADQRVWQVIASIPVGKVATYGQVAELAGLGRGARYVGSVLRKLPKETKLPWHRVVNAQGKIAFPQGSDAYEAQRARLEDEGVSYINGKIDMKLFRWIT